MRPPQAKRDKPRVAAFTSARIDKILALEPDLVLGFCDLQADIAASLICAGVAVHVFNQRSPGWEAIPAVRDGHLYEIKSCDILQPGPAARSNGVQQMHAIVRRWADGCEGERG